VQNLEIRASPWSQAFESKPGRPPGQTDSNPADFAMARRFLTPYQSEPVSRLATWSRNLAIFSVVAVVVSILIVRFGFLEMKPALATFFGALGLAVLSILVGLAAFAAIWQNGSRGMGRILLAFLINAASRRWHGCAAAKAPTRRSMPGSIRPNSNAPTIPILKRWNSKCRLSGPMR
jgi:hypothetical protein